MPSIVVDAIDSYLSGTAYFNGKVSATGDSATDCFATGSRSSAQSTESTGYQSGNGTTAFYSASDVIGAKATLSCLSLYG